VRHCAILLVLISVFSGDVLLNRAVADLEQARELHRQDAWKGEFPIARSNSQIAGQPIVEAHARWNRMTDGERREVMKRNYRSAVRGGVFVAWPESAADQTGEKTKSTDSSKNGAGQKSKQAVAKKAKK